MVSKHGSYLVFLLISGLPIKPGRTSGAMFVEPSGLKLVEGSGGVYSTPNAHLIFV